MSATKRIKATATKQRRCAGKRNHPDGAAARAHIASLEQRGTAKGAMTAYTCQHCGSWHVGHAPGRRLRRRS